jgi:hypothetical protein
MKKILPYAQLLSVTCALLVGISTFVRGAAEVFPVLARAETATGFIAGMVAFCAGVLLAGGVVYFLSLAALVTACRGRAFLAIASVSDCRGVSAWMCSSWNFFGAGGRQSGVRVFGLEVALHGRL